MHCQEIIVVSFFRNNCMLPRWIQCCELLECTSLDKGARQEVVERATAKERQCGMSPPHLDMRSRLHTVDPCFDVHAIYHSSQSHDHNHSHNHHIVAPMKEALWHPVRIATA